MEKPELSAQAVKIFQVFKMFFFFKIYISFLPKQSHLFFYFTVEFSFSKYFRFKNFLVHKIYCLSFYKVDGKFVIIIQNEIAYLHKTLIKSYSFKKN